RRLCARSLRRRPRLALPQPLAPRHSRRGGGHHCNSSGIDHSAPTTIRADSHLKRKRERFFLENPKSIKARRSTRLRSFLAMARIVPLPFFLEALQRVACISSADLDALVRNFNAAIDRLAPPLNVSENESFARSVAVDTFWRLFGPQLRWLRARPDPYTNLAL